MVEERKEGGASSEDIVLERQEARHFAANGVQIGQTEMKRAEKGEQRWWRGVEGEGGEGRRRRGGIIRG